MSEVLAMTEADRAYARYLLDWSARLEDGLTQQLPLTREQWEDKNEREDFNNASPTRS